MEKNKLFELVGRLVATELSITALTLFIEQKGLDMNEGYDFIKQFLKNVPEEDWKKMCSSVLSEVSQ